MDKKINGECDRSIFTLAQPVIYEIKIVGHLGENWPNWLGIVDVHTEIETPGFPTTILTGSLDQAALLGLLAELIDGRKTEKVMPVLLGDS
jgi:hypothetical protein